MISPRAAACLLLGLLGLVALQAASAASDDTPPLWLRQPATAEVTWRGMLPTEGGGVGMGPQIGPYLVPPGVAGLLAAILTHAAINQGMQSAARKREQDDADRVLEPYRATLREWPASALWAAAALTPGAGLRLLDDGTQAPEAVIAEVVPVFTMAQDESALWLDASVKLLAAPGVLPQDMMVRVISSPQDAADARAHWSADDAQRLKALAAGLLAQALRIARQHAEPAPGAETPPMRTYRYLQGKLERTERAQWLSGDCDRAVLRTLRGWLLSVPLQPSLEKPCPRTTPF